MLRAATTASLPSHAETRPPLARTSLRLALDPYRALLFLITVLTISRIHQHFPAIARLRPVLPLFLLALMVIVLGPRSVALSNLFRTWPPKVIAGLAILACLSAPFGISFGASAQFLVSNYSSILLYAFLLFIGIRRARDLYTFVWAFVVSIAALVWLSISVFRLSLAPGATAVQRLSELYSYDSNDLGCVLLVGLVFTVLTLLTSGRKGRVASAALLVGIGISLARTGSRGAFLGLIGTGCVLLLTLKQVSVAKRLGFVAVTVAGLVVAAPPGYWGAIGTVLHPSGDYNWQSQEGRREIWFRGLGYMLDHPLVGIGINNFERAEGTISDKARRSFAGDPIRWTAPHNSFVQVGAELGFPGLILWSSLIIGGIVGMVRMRRRLPRAWLQGDAEERFLYLATIHLPLALVGFAIPAFFLSFAYSDIVSILAAFVAGVYVSVGDKIRRARLQS